MIILCIVLGLSCGLKIWFDLKKLDLDEKNNN